MKTYMALEYPVVYRLCTGSDLKNAMEPSGNLQDKVIRGHLISNFACGELESSESELPFSTIQVKRELSWLYLVGRVAPIAIRNRHEETIFIVRTVAKFDNFDLGFFWRGNRIENLYPKRDHVSSRVTPVTMLSVSSEALTFWSMPLTICKWLRSWALDVRPDKFVSTSTSSGFPVYLFPLLNCN